MSFFEVVKTNSFHKTSYIKTNRTTFLQVHSKNKLSAYTTPKKNITTRKRMSPCLTKVKAAISVEAALALPLFIFFMANLMMLILIFKDYSESLSKVQQTTRLLALTSNSINDNSELITNTKQIAISPLINEIAFSKKNITVGITYRKWNGFNVTGECNENEEEEYVYVAKYGTVYHMNRDCKHLNVDVKIVSPEQISSLTNNNMEKYSACDICNGAGSGILFVTEGGNKYHGSSNCSGLKRTVRMVKKSEVGGMPACSVCGR